MVPYNNPRIYLANLVKYEYDKEKKEYIPFILDAKIPVVFIPGYGYYTNQMDCKMPLYIVDVNHYNHPKVMSKYYITNVKSIDRYTDNPSELLHNWYSNSLKLMNELGMDGQWHTIDDIELDKPLYKSIKLDPDMKLDDNLYVAKMASKVKRIQNYDGSLIKDEYINISNNYGLFSYGKGILTSKLTGYEYDKLEYKHLRDAILCFDLDLKYSTTPIYSREELGLTNIYDLHEFISTFHLYIDPNKDVLKQINSYENLKQGYKLRTIKELNKFNDDIILTRNQQESLNKEIMIRTLKK